MKKLTTLNLLWAIALSAIFTTSFAGSRYEDSPTNLVEVYNFTQQTAEAIKRGNQAAALDVAKKGRKLAYQSSRKKSTIPMQVANTTLTKAIKSLKNNDLVEASGYVDKVLGKLSSEIDYFKNEDKL